MSAEDVRIVREALIAWHIQTPTMQRTNAQKARAALARLEARIAELTGRNQHLSTWQPLAEAAEARAERYAAALQLIANRTHPATYLGRRDDGTEMYGGSDDAARFALTALTEQPPAERCLACEWLDQPGGLLHNPNAPYCSRAAQPPAENTDFEWKMQEC